MNKVEDSFIEDEDALEIDRRQSSLRPSSLMRGSSHFKIEQREKEKAEVKGTGIEK